MEISRKMQLLPTAAPWAEPEQVASSLVFGALVVPYSCAAKPYNV